MITVSVKRINPKTQLIEETTNQYEGDVLQSDLQGLLEPVSRSPNVIKIVIDIDGVSTVFYGPLSYLEDE